MKQLFENWRSHVNESSMMTEISFDDAKKRLESKALLKWIKGMAFDEEMRVMTLNPDQIEAAKNALAEVVLQFVPEDLTDNQKGTTLEWIISIGINDPRVKQKFYNEATAPGGAEGVAYAHTTTWRRDLERYWHTHEYSQKKDIFSIKTCFYYVLF